MPYKALNEVVAALAERLPESKTEKNYDGFTTVKWTEAARQLDAIFGPFGWSDRVVSSQADGERGLYTVTRELTVRALDADGSVVSKVVSGVGTSIAAVRKGESTPTTKAHKTAIMGAASIAFSKATKLLGDAFGLYLYDGDEEAPSEAPAKRSNAPAKTGGALSEKQVYSLGQAGLDAKTIAGLSRQQASDLLNLYFEGGRKPFPAKGKVAAQVVAILDSGEDEDEEGTPF